MQNKLDRSLGLFSAITISVGTMIGSAIFVIAGISFETAGPSASLSIFLSGISALFTALSFAELVTFIPKEGGGYTYVREATNNGVLGFICGWGFWLGYAMSCSLFAIGFGNFLNYFFPFIPREIGSYLLIIYVVATNIKGIKSAGKLQDVITVGLILLLFGYIFYGMFFIKLDNQAPYFPNGIAGTFKAMGFLYMTYIGYGLITTASEEVVKPEKTIPKAIIISMIIVIFIKTATFFVGSSIINWTELTPDKTKTPMTDTAVEIGERTSEILSGNPRPETTEKKGFGVGGRIGGYLFALAGILATLSSINTAIMASSRTSYTLARDKKFPPFFKTINSKTKTPIFSILTTAIIVIIATSLRNLEHLSTITSLFSLIGYSLVNIAVIVFRKKLPNAERKFKVPLFPLTPILGILINMFMVFQLLLSDWIALVVAFSIVVIGIIYYYLILPLLKQAPQGVTPQIVPSIKTDSLKTYPDGYNILVPIANPQTVKPLIEMGLNVIKYETGKIIPIHIVKISEIIPLDYRYSELKTDITNYEAIISEIKNYEEDIQHKTDPQLIFSRDIPNAIARASIETKAKLLMIGWNKSGIAYKLFKGFVSKILKDVKITVAIFKKGVNNNIKKILFPYGGGIHSQEAINIVQKIAKTTNSITTILRVIEEDDTSEEEIKEIDDILIAGLKKLNLEGNAKIIKHKSRAEAIIEEARNYDLIILGATERRFIPNYLIGYTVDKVIENTNCNVLVIRKYDDSILNKILKKLTHIKIIHKKFSNE